MSDQDEKGGQFDAPSLLPPGPLGEEALRNELISLKSRLCEDLIYTAGIILSTGILSEVPKEIQELTGMRIDELEELETRACLETGSDRAAELTTAELLNEVRTIEWLVKLHLAAMGAVTERSPRTRPINAEGAFAAFLELHDVVVAEMRRHAAALQHEPTLEAAHGFALFWQNVVLTHAQAEDRALWPLARSLGDDGLARSADMLEAEHNSIDEQVANYAQTLRLVEQDQAPLSNLVPLAQDIRGRVELHFAKEEESVVRLLQARVSDTDFTPVLREQQEAIGAWLKAHGWKGLTA